MPLNAGTLAAYAAGIEARARTQQRLGEVIGDAIANARRKKSIARGLDSALQKVDDSGRARLGLPMKEEWDNYSSDRKIATFEEALMLRKQQQELAMTDAKLNLLNQQITNEQRPRYQPGSVLTSDKMPGWAYLVQSETGGGTWAQTGQYPKPLTALQEAQLKLTNARTLESEARTKGLTGGAEQAALSAKVKNARAQLEAMKMTGEKRVYFRFDPQMNEFVVAPEAKIIGVPYSTYNKSIDQALAELGPADTDVTPTAGTAPRPPTGALTPPAVPTTQQYAVPGTGPLANRAQYISNGYFWQEQRDGTIAPVGRVKQENGKFYLEQVNGDWLEMLPPQNPAP